MYYAHFKLFISDLSFLHYLQFENFFKLQPDYLVEKIKKSASFVILRMF